MLLYVKKVKQWIFRNYCRLYIASGQGQTAPRGQNFVVNNFVTKGLSAPVTGLYTCIKSLKKCIKSDFNEIFLKLVANDRSDKRFLLTSKFCPLGLSAPTSGYMHLLNHEKMCIKSEVEEILFKLATHDHTDEAFLLTTKFWP